MDERWNGKGVIAAVLVEAWPVAVASAAGRKHQDDPGEFHLGDFDWGRVPLDPWDGSRHADLRASVHAAVKACDTIAGS